MPSQAITEKRNAAIAYLGDRWLASRSYKLLPRHSVRPEVWQRASVLNDVREQARKHGRIE